MDPSSPHTHVYTAAGDYEVIVNDDTGIMPPVATSVTVAAAEAKRSR